MNSTIILVGTASTSLLDLLFFGASPSEELKRAKTRVPKIGHARVDQEPSKGHFSKAVFCRIQCRAQENKNYSRTLGLAATVLLALRAPQPREA